MSTNAEKILVTGPTGFIAGNLINALVRDGHHVTGAGRRPPPLWVTADCGFARLDVRDFDATLALLRREPWQTVYHLAAYSTLTAGQDEGARAMLETNVAGTWNLLEACRRADVPVVVVASSDKQYGALAPPPYDDNDSTAFQNGGLYELSKAQQDQTARLYAGLYDTPTVRVARLVNVYGPGDTQWTRIVPGNIRRTVQNEPPRVTSGPAGAALREYLFVDDAVSALRALAVDAKTRGNAPLRTSGGKLARVAFNTPTGHKFPAAEVIAIIQTILRNDFGIVGPAPEFLPGPPGVFEPGHQFAHPDKFRAFVPGWHPRDLETGLRTTIPWYLDHLRA